MYNHTSPSNILSQINSMNRNLKKVSQNNFQILCLITIIVTNWHQHHYQNIVSEIRKITIDELLSLEEYFHKH